MTTESPVLTVLLLACALAVVAIGAAVAALLALVGTARKLSRKQLETMLNREGKL